VRHASSNTASLIYIITTIHETARVEPNEDENKVGRMGLMGRMRYWTTKCSLRGEWRWSGMKAANATRTSCAAGDLEEGEKHHAASQHGSIPIAPLAAMDLHPSHHATRDLDRCLIESRKHHRRSPLTGQRSTTCSSHLTDRGLGWGEAPHGQGTWTGRSTAAHRSLIVSIGFQPFQNHRVSKVRPGQKNRDGPDGAHLIFCT
jgi:hypothetical protein